MPRLEVPLTYRRLRSTGDVVVLAELALAIKTERGNWETVTFLIDSGTEMSTMPAADAKNRGFPSPTGLSQGCICKVWRSARDCSGRGFRGRTRPNMSSLVTFSVIRSPGRPALGACSA